MNQKWMPVLILAWAGLAVAGMRVMVAYESTPGSQAESVPKWPKETSLRREPGQPALVVFLHPRCSCSEATLTELSRLLEENPGRVRATLVFSMPEQPAPEWLESPLMQRASSLSGVTVVADLGGKEAHRFGAATSGFSAVYGADGLLRFAGGITGGRGLVGDNTNARALNAAIRTASPGSPGSPGAARAVFGCALDQQPAQSTETVN